ncbi:nuclear transport factor 2 family protein [Mucilaginibacter sp. FT3.2]|uniref:nuclear transport factor 2 family protein n=1 Tax=Mucilaginibacter sp. FT3.2 TaxID=2723090 RepID=UPI00160F355C|nr:nuclear transport factor 2 family protein [Mucilaginibacter sp. FT3.2]MBB6232334.1 hypothetical protein [Mucilaginibacter sp. FT3.2]
MSLEILEAKAAIREVFDTYAIYSDEDRLEDYKKLFIPDARVIIYFDGKLGFDLQGTDKVIEVFTAFTVNVKTKYHMNGQLLLNVNGDNATGIGYCKAHLVSAEDDKEYITEHCIRYDDTYVRENGSWFISHRISHFNIADKRLLL